MTREDAISILNRPRTMKNVPSDILEAHEIAIKALKQESIIDKIRVEIIKLQTYKMFEGEDTVYVERDDVLEIINKYKAESEEEE